MFFIYLVIVALSALSAVVLSVEEWRNAASNWLAALLAIGKTELLRIRRYIRNALWVLTADFILVLIAVMRDMHGAIITLAVINGLILYLMVETTRFRMLSKVRQPIGYVFLIITNLCLFELALPGFIRHGLPWFFGLVVAPLIIGQVYTLSQFRGAGFTGFKVLLSWIIVLSVIVLGNKFFDNYFAQLVLDKEFNDSKSDLVTYVKVVAPTGVYKISETGFGPFTEISFSPTNDISADSGSVWAMPISKYDLDAQGLPIVEYKRRRLIPIVQKIGDFFDEKEYFILRQSVEKTENPYLPKKHSGQKKITLKSQKKTAYPIVLNGLVIGKEFNGIIDGLYFSNKAYIPTEGQRVKIYPYPEGLTLQLGSHILPVGKEGGLNGPTWGTIDINGNDGTSALMLKAEYVSKVDSIVITKRY